MDQSVPPAQSPVEAARADAGDLVTPGRTARDESDLAGIRRWLVMAKQSRYSHEGREHRQMRVDIDSGQVDFGRCAVDVSVNVEADQWRRSAIASTRLG